MQNLSLICWLTGKKRTESASVKTCLVKQMLMKSSCRTDLAPADFSLFPSLKTTLKGHHFQDIEEINHLSGYFWTTYNDTSAWLVKENATRQLYAIKQNAFQEAFQKWKKCWQCAVASGGYTLKGSVRENYISYLIKFFYLQFSLFLNTPHK